MILGLALLFIVAVLDWISVARGWRKLELIAKPATMVVLFSLFFLYTQLGKPPFTWIAVGMLFALLGDVLLLIRSDSFQNFCFLVGMAAFLMAYICYIVGLILPLSNGPLIWSIGIAVVLALTIGHLLRTILAGVRRSGNSTMALAVAVYGVVITLMLLSALLILSNPNWKLLPSILASLGGVFLFASDLFLAWNKFVTPSRFNDTLIMILYHLGQFGLVAGIALQYVS
jgi:uncharacterized membrane protein YhhN